jgi:hypothetical protein
MSRPKGEIDVHDASNRRSRGPRVRPRCRPGCDESGDRARAFAEARRLLGAAVALRHRLALQDPLDRRREVSRAPHRVDGNKRDHADLMTS